jgi:multidrug efflux system outer membrane protein
MTRPFAGRSPRRRTAGRGGGAALALAVALAGCQATPPTRPEVTTPAGWRSPSSTATTLAVRPWSELFMAEELDVLIREGLAANSDLIVAAERVELARAQFGIARSELFPQLGGQLAYDRQRVPVAGSATNVVVESSVLGLALSPWEIDVWGRVRAATESARRQVLASDETRLALQSSLVAQIASLYLRLLALDAQLALSEDTGATRRESLRLIDARFRGGVASKLEVQDATSLVAQADQTIANVLRLRLRTENALSVLIGRNAGEIRRERRLQEFALPLLLPAGLPSELLLRRPDLLAAEQNLAAQDASVEAARLAFFPSITLTGLLGLASPALRDLFDSGRYAWQVSPAVTIPIFTAGRLQSNLEANEAQRRIALEQYKSAVRIAFREVDDALADYQRFGEQRSALATAVSANRERLRLSTLRYRGGVAAYFEVLDASRQLFDAELAFISVLQAQYEAIIELYRALGGGEEPAMTPPDLPATPTSPRRAQG